MMDTSKLLPIGTVVLLEKGTKEVMITGFYTVTDKDPNVTYDYCGCLYPEGVLSSDQNLMFNHNQIVKVSHFGYKSDKEIEFKKKLGEAIKQLNGN